MKKSLYLVVLSLLFLSCINIHAQTQRFDWEFEMCTCSGNYDSNKLTKQQLINTYEYLLQGKTIEAKHLAWRPEEIKEIDVEEIEKQFDVIYTKLKTLEFIETPFWKTLKEDRIIELKAQYLLKKLTAQAYTNPKLLKNFQLHSNACDKYILALTEGGDIMLNEWKKLNEEMKKQNGSPQRLQEEFDKKMSSPQKLEYARIDLMLFGFWNKALTTIPQLEGSWNYESNFKKLFTNVKCDCETP